MSPSTAASQLLKLVVLVIACLAVPMSAQSCQSPTAQCECFIDQGKTIINCRYKGLSSVPAFNSVNIVYDEIRFGGTNNITQIGATDFNNLKVKSINLLENTISSISDQAFINLNSYLESLYLEGNGAVDFPHQAIAPLEKLQVLHLENYGTAEINTSTVMPFPVLEKLTLKNWPRLRNIVPDSFNVMANLSELSLHTMGALSTLPVPAIQKFYRNLFKLEIIETGISSILGDVFSPLSKLNAVTIQRNKNLKSIDNGAFSGVTDTITFLDLDTNVLTSLNFLKSLNWTVISHLNIGYNFDLQTLPAGLFSTMPTLDYLSCQDIGLISVDESMFRGLGNLHTLDLGYNKISTIGAAAFQHSPGLTDLRLNNQNPLTGNVVFNDNAFSGIVTSLENLNIQENTFSLTQMWRLVSKLPNLKLLELKQVSILNIPDRVFTNNTKLETLVLSNNNITSVKQETFYGPRDTLSVIDLSGNVIERVPVCTLGDFSTKPTLKLANNPLNCDCHLIWLHDWFNAQPNKDSLAFEVGSCETPSELAGKYFTQFTRTDMCSTNIPIVTCPDLYATTTTSTTTTTTTTTTTSRTTTIPLPVYELLIANEETEFIQVTWHIPDKTYVTGLKLVMQSNQKPTETKFLGSEEKSFTFYNLEPDSFYSFCLYLKVNEVYRFDPNECKSGQTKPTDYSWTPSSTTAIPGQTDTQQLGIIIGASVGGIVLVGLIIAILVVLLKSNQPKKPKPVTQPVSFAMRADIPHAGGTAKHFQRKSDKEGATPDDINITVISNGDIANRDRISAGSYQALNEKGVDLHPNPSASYGHYSNNVENRALPQTPDQVMDWQARAKAHSPDQVMDWQARAKAHSYVNTGGAQPLPETSKNEYSEVKY